MRRPAVLALVLLVLATVAPAKDDPVEMAIRAGYAAEGLEVSIAGPGVDKKEIPATMLFQRR